MNLMIAGLGWRSSLIIPNHLRTTLLTASMGFPYDTAASEAAVLIFRLPLHHRLSSPQKYLRMTVFLRGEMRLVEGTSARRGTERSSRLQSSRSSCFASETDSRPISTWPIATATRPATATSIEFAPSRTNNMHASGKRYPDARKHAAPRKGKAYDSVRPSSSATICPTKTPVHARDVNTPPPPPP